MFGRIRAEALRTLSDKGCENEAAAPVTRRTLMSSRVSHTLISGVGVAILLSWIFGTLAGRAKSGSHSQSETGGRRTLGRILWVDVGLRNEFDARGWRFRNLAVTSWNLGTLPSDRLVAIAWIERMPGMARTTSVVLRPMKFIDRERKLDSGLSA